MSDEQPAAQIRERQRLREALDSTLMRVEDAKSVVGREIPSWVEDWAERNGLDVQRSEFAPPDQLFIVGAVPVRMTRSDPTAAHDHPTQRRIWESRCPVLLAERDELRALLLAVMVAS